MSSLTNLFDGLRSLRSGNIAGLRPPYPPVVLEMVRDEVTLVRLKRRGRGRPILEMHQSRPLPERSVPSSLFDVVPLATDELAGKLRELFEVSGTRPARVSLVLPDNLAKITLLQLPERPASRKQLGEIVQAKMRRAVPFRLDEAALSYQLLAGEGRQVSVLVVVVRRATVERFERALEAVGARPGLVDISTPNLINLCRSRLGKASRGEGDAALLNCARNYFSLVILRDDRVIFFRCKTFAPGDDVGAGANGPLSREIANSFSYYREKLEGQGVRTVFVRGVALEPEEITPKLLALGCERVEKVDPAEYIELADGVTLDSQAGQRLAPAIGAATGEESVMQTLDLNLAARPFTNNVLVWVGYVVGFAALAGFTGWTGNTYREHVGLLHELRSDAGQIEGQMRDFETRGVRAVNGIERFDLDSLEVKAAKANEVIEWKAFSWTRLFNRMAEMQPWNVRMTSIRPIFRGGREAGARFAMTGGMTREAVPVAINAIARSYDDMLEMQRALFEHPNFGRVAMERFNTGQNNEIVFQLRFLYYPETVEDEGGVEAEGTDDTEVNEIVADAVEVDDEWAEQEQEREGGDGASGEDVAQDGGTEP